MGFAISDAVILLILAAFVIYGLKCGFIKSVFSLFSLFFTGLMTWFLYPILAGALINTPLYGWVHTLILNTLSDNEALAQSLPEFFAGLPDFMKNSIMESSKQAFNSLIGSVSEAMTVLTVNIISIIIVFIVVRFSALLLKKFSHKINKLFIIGKINQLLGGVFGFAQGVFVVYLLVLTLSFFPTAKLYEYVAEDIPKSFVAKKLFNEKARFLGMKVRYPKILVTEGTDGNDGL